MAPVNWSIPASLQLAAIVDYIEHFDPAAVRRLERRLVEMADSLQKRPDRGRPIGLGRREMMIVRPYILRYEHHDGVVLILGVRHAAQLPDDLKTLP